MLFIHGDEGGEGPKKLITIKEKYPLDEIVSPSH